MVLIFNLEVVIKGSTSENLRYMQCAWSIGTRGGEQNCYSNAKILLRYNPVWASFLHSPTKHCWALLLGPSHCPSKAMEFFASESFLLLIPQYYWIQYRRTVLCTLRALITTLFMDWKETLCEPEQLGVDQNTQISASGNYFLPALRNH